MSALVETFSTDDLARGLERASDDMKREVGALIPLAATTMESLLVARYPTGTRPHPGVPHMEDDIVIRSQYSNDHLLPKKRVRGPRLAYIWQNGTKLREYVTAHGATHRTGAAKPQDTDFFERTAVRTRAQFMAQAQAILDRPREI